LAKTNLACNLGTQSYTGNATYHTEYDTAAGSNSALTVNCGLDVSTVKLGSYAVTALQSVMYGVAAYCGDFLNVTGPNGWTVVQVIDQCGGCSGPASLDLSENAFGKIGSIASGVIPITWYVIPGTSILGNAKISYRFKDGSSQFYLNMQILNHLIPITAVIYSQNGTNTTSVKQDYNYWLKDSGSFNDAGFQLYLVGSSGETIVQNVGSILKSSTSEATLVTGNVQFKNPCLGEGPGPTPTPTPTVSRAFNPYSGDMLTICLLILVLLVF